MRAIGLAIVEAMARTVPSIDHALGLIGSPGQRSVATVAAIEARDSAIISLHRLGWSPRKIEASLQRYFMGEWRHHRIANECPESLRGGAREQLWRALKARPMAIKARQIKDIICSELDLFAAECSADNDNAPT